MNNFDKVNCLGMECRKTANTEGDNCKPLEKGSGCIDNVIPSEFPEYNALKDAVKGKGSVVACAEVRKTLAGNRKYLVVLKTKKTEDNDEGYEVDLFSLANGLYNKMGPFPTLDSALSRADCFGLFEGEVMKVNTESRIREAVGDYLYDDEDGNPVYDGGIEDWDDLGYDDPFDGEMEDAEYKITAPKGFNNGVNDDYDYDPGFDGEFDDGSLSADQVDDEFERSVYEDLDNADADNETLGNGRLITASKAGIQNNNDQQRDFRSLASRGARQDEEDYGFYYEGKKVDKKALFEALLNKKSLKEMGRLNTAYTKGQPLLNLKNVCENLKLVLEYYIYDSLYWVVKEYNIDAKRKLEIYDNDKDHCKIFVRGINDGEPAFAIDFYVGDCSFRENIDRDTLNKAIAKKDVFILNDPVSVRVSASGFYNYELDKSLQKLFQNDVECGIHIPASEIENLTQKVVVGDPAARLVKSLSGWIGLTTKELADRIMDEFEKIPEVISFLMGE